MLVAISECDSLSRPRHSICLQLLIKPIAYVHPGIPSYPSVKSPLLLPLLLPLPIPTSFPFPPSPLPPSHLPPQLPHCPLSISSSRCPPPHCHPLPVPIAPLPISPSLLPPSRFPLPVSNSPLPSTPNHPPPSFLSTLPTSHFPQCFRPLPAPQHPFPHCPSPHRQLGLLIDSNQVCHTYQ